MKTPLFYRNITFRKFDILPMSVIITPDEVYDTYVEIDKNMLNVKIYNSLIQKAKDVKLILYNILICFC